MWTEVRENVNQRVMTDNGSAYMSFRFRDLCRVLNVRHIRIRPHRPQTNGKVERVIQTLLREWAYRFSYRSSEERQCWLVPYLHFYNVHRAHSALDSNAPISRLDRKERPDTQQLDGAPSHVVDHPSGELFT